MVVLPGGKILFRAVKPPNIKITREEWYNTNNNITRKIKSEEGISLKPDVSTLEIDNATTENSGTYQLSVECSLGTLKSNTITVFVDGNFLCNVKLSIHSIYIFHIKINIPCSYSQS